MMKFRLPFGGLRRFSTRPDAVVLPFGERIRYPAAGAYVQSDLAASKYTQRPIPLNVQLTQLEPIKLPMTHGDLVAEVVVSSFFGPKDVEFIAEFLLRTAFYLGIPARGPTPMPRKIKRWTVIRSPFVHAKSKENWERRTWRQQIKLYDANPEVVQILLAIASKHRLAGTGVHARTYTQESADDLSAENLGERADAESVLALNKVDLDASKPSGEVARAVLELLKDPRFANPELESQITEQLKE